MSGLVVRGWLPIGPDAPLAAFLLPADRELFQGVGGPMPDAALAVPGQWIVWGPSYEDRATYVCVEVEIG